MKEPSNEAVAEAVVDMFTRATLDSQTIDPSFRMPFLGGAIAAALGISVLAAYSLLGSMS